MAKRTSAKGVRAAAAAGAAVVAGGVAAGKVARDRARRAEDRHRAFRLQAGEEPSVGVRRIARGQLDSSAEHLDARRNGELGDAVHEVRKSFKRLRAVVRLVRDDLGTEVYRRENEAFRDAGRRLSDVRDAKVLVETLDDLVRRYADEIPDGAFARLRGQLAAEQERAHERLEHDAAAIDGTRDALDRARTRVAAWPLTAGAGPAVLASGFERVYRRGRRALRAARKDPTVENLHELRKRAKDLWHAAQVARPVDPKRMRKLAQSAHKLADVIGEDHDLAVLGEAAARRGATLRPDELALLRALVDRRRARLTREALERGRRVYAAKPRKLVRRFGAAPA
jgi:CHAD domain-containing protein